MANYLQQTLHMSMKKFLLGSMVLFSTGAIAQNLEKGIREFEVEKYRSAIKELTGITQADTGNLKAYYYTGLVYLDLDEFDNA